MNAESEFGYIVSPYSNIGDDIQSLAAKNFLPENSIAIQREHTHQFQHDTPVKTLMNGWFLWPKRFDTVKNVPKVVWPPSSSIDPLFISFHISKEFIPIALSPAGVEYFKQNAPIGARDLATLKMLQQRKIPSYFSGCLTLTLINDSMEKDDIIYVVDLEDAYATYIQSKTKSQVVSLTHIIDARTSPEKRLELTKEILEKYKKAKAVVTSRLHAAMPCLAYGTPVLLLNIQTDPYRLDGLRELTWNCSKDEFFAGFAGFNFDSPPENPTAYIPLREKMIETITEWMNRNVVNNNQSVAGIL